MPSVVRIAAADAPPPAGPYVPAVRVGDFVFISGQTARRPGGGIPDCSDREGQCRQALMNLKTVARAAGGDLGDLVKVTVFLSDLSWKTVFDEVYAELVGSGAARSTVCAVPPNGHVEVEGILFLAGSDA